MDIKKAAKKLNAALIADGHLDYDLDYCERQLSFKNGSKTEFSEKEVEDEIKYAINRIRFQMRHRWNSFSLRCEPQNY